VKVQGPGGGTPWLTKLVRACEIEFGFEADIKTDPARDETRVRIVNKKKRTRIVTRAVYDTVVIIEQECDLKRDAVP
jgi:hypothetical protein